MNWSLFCVVYLIAVTVTMGVFIVAALVTILGMIAAIPEALFFSKKVGSITGNEA